jgi:hypothetical protein
MAAAAAPAAVIVAVPLAAPVRATTSAANPPAASIQSTLNTVQVVLRCADSNGSVVRLDLATLTIKLG